jgi:hypothetical protein
MCRASSPIRVAYTSILTETVTVSLTNPVTWTATIPITATDGSPAIPTAKVLSATATSAVTVNVLPEEKTEEDDGNIYLPYVRK